MKTFTVEANVYDEYYDDGPTHAVIEVNSELAKQIIKMQEAVKSCDAYCIQEFDSAPDFMVKENPEDEADHPALIDWEDGSIDCCLLHVTQTGFFWSANIKHSDINIETENIPIEELKELL